MATPESAPPPGALAGALDPSSALSVEEAATLAGVGADEIEAQIGDGSLLSERQRVRGFGGTRREKVVVRLLDLADVYPHVLGRPERAEEPAPDQNPSPREPQPTESEPTESQPIESEPEYLLPRPDEGRAELADGVPRAALVQLCEDLETRLDLAERERQASTASLLMAQRRVLDLEADARRRPLRAYTQVAACAVAGAALFVALRAPGRAAEAARSAVEGTSAPFAERMEAALDEASRASREQAVSGAAFLEAFADRTGARVEGLEDTLARALDEARTAREALAQSIEVSTDDQRVRAEETAARSRAERLELEKRLDAADALLVAARGALEAERQGRADDARAAVESATRTQAAVERLEASLGAERAALEALRSDWEAQMEAQKEVERQEAAPQKGGGQDRADDARSRPWWIPRGVRAPW